MSSIEQKVRRAGIVGAGGAGFPTHVKFASKADTVIANGAECEPLLQCDKAVMRAEGARVLTGLRLLAEATGAGRAVIAVKGKYRDVVEALRKAAWESFPAVEIFELDNYYPAGDEQIMVHEVTGRVIPEGGIPIKVGVVVDNVITLRQVAAAVEEGRPVTSRPLTVTGEVEQPLTCELPIGTRLGEAVEAAGGARVDDWVIVEGGPMMGRVVTDPDQPITKKTSGVIVLPTAHPLVARIQASTEREVALARTVCCQCRMCTDLCPRFNLGHRIQPHLTMRTLLAHGLLEPSPEQLTSAYLCCLCGVCETYACPLGLSPRKVYADLKQRLSEAGTPNPFDRADCSPNEFQRRRHIPLPRLVARLGLTEYVDRPHRFDLRPREVAAVRIPLSQHIGAPARPVVERGQQVERGQLIAEIPEGKLGAAVHASIDGRVRHVDERTIGIERS